MEVSAVNIAAVLLHDKAVTSRPPSGKRDRDKFINNYARQLSSTVAKNYRPGSGTIRQSSARTSNVKLFVKVDQHHKKKETPHLPSQTRESKDTHKRRVQSAKARLTHSDTTKTKPKPERRFSSARVRWGTNETKTTNSIPTIQPELNLRQHNDTSGSSISLTKVSKRNCRSESDLSRVGKPLKSCLKSSSQNISSQHSLSSKADDGLTDEALGVLVDDEDTDEDSEEEEEVTDNTKLPLPKTLRQLAHWWTPDIPPEYLGIDHLRCWVFLPSMVKDYENLPVVPSVVTDPTEPLPCKEIIRPPVQWTKRPLQEWSCKHGHAPLVPPLKILNNEGCVVHETNSGRRTVGVVRREIAELERLMRGVGTAGSSSLVVQYQYEINQLQQMIDDTLPRVEQIERREREKEEALQRQIKDYCGLRKFCKDHDEVMRQIRVQHDKCVRELAILERGLQLDSERAHFRKTYKESGNSSSRQNSTRSVPVQNKR